MTDSKTNAVHETISRDEEVKGSSDRAFGVVFTVVFLIIGLFPLIRDGNPRIWALIVAGLFLAVALAHPILLAPLNRLWTRFGLLLHKITNPIIMGLVFFVTVTPTALIMKLMGKDPLNRKIDRNAKSYWIERQPPGPSPETMKNQF
ncbi:MAG: SxtJ family membrane protein [Proteobacteria bacterium]|nr:SxtJ family membrane protein [Pseudomonadota bacterium]